MSRKNKFYILGTSLTVSSLIFPLGMGISSSNIQPNEVKMQRNFPSDDGVGMKAEMSSSLQRNKLITSALTVMDKSIFKLIFAISDDGVLTVRDQKWLDTYLKNNSGKLDISKFNKVKAIGEKAFYDTKELVEVILPKSLEKIENEAFSKCNELQKVNLGSLTNLKFIGERAFYSTNLISIIIPESVKIDPENFKSGIGYCAFWESNNLKTVTFLGKKRSIFQNHSDQRKDEFFFPKTVKIFYFENQDFLEYVKSKLKYDNNVGWKLINVSEYFSIDNKGTLTVKNIPGLKNYLQSYNGSLDISKWNKVRVLNKKVFLNFAELKSIVLPNSLEEIGSQSFYKCKNLENITIPQKVSIIGASAFYECKSLKKINIPENVNRIGSNAFYGCENLESILIPESVKEIGYNAFYSCFKLNSKNIINNSPVLFKLWVNKHLYSEHNNMSIIQIINDRENVDLSQFKNSLGKEFAIIGNGAFSWPSSLASITIPESIKVIGTNAFSGCKNLESVTFQGDNQQLDLMYDAFPDSVKFFYFDNKDLLKKLSGKLVKQKCYLNSGDFVLNFDQTVLVKLTSQGKTKSSLTNIPDSVKTIAPNAFQDSQASTMSIPFSVTHIDDKAFYECRKLENVIFQGKDRSFTLENNAFQNTDIKFFYFEDQGFFNKLCNILGKDKCRLSDGDFVFDASKVLVGLTETGKQKETLIVPNSVTTIGNSAFAQNEKLINVIIPESVKKIETQAFAGCSNLKSVTFQGNNANLNLGEESFSDDNNAYYYFEVQGLFDSLKSQFEKAKIDKSKCIVTVGKLFVIDGNNTLTSLTDEGKQQKELEIPNFVTKIGDKAFQGSQASTINIPSSVTTIGAKAFEKCANLKTLRFIGDWGSGEDKEISFDAFADLKIDNDFHIYVEKQDYIVPLQNKLTGAAAVLRDKVGVEWENSLSNGAIAGIAFAAIFGSICVILGIVIPIVKRKIVTPHHCNNDY